PLRLVELKVRDRHLAGENEGDGPCKEAEKNEQAADKLERAADPGLGPESRRSARGWNAAEPAEELLPAVVHEEQPGHDAQEEESRRSSSIHSGHLVNRERARSSPTGRSPCSLAEFSTSADRRFRIR